MILRKCQLKSSQSNLFERQEGGERAVLVHINFHHADDQEDIAEFQDLVLSAGVVPVKVITGTRTAPDAKLFAGKGKVQEIKEIVEATCADIILFNHALTPSQERNLERVTECRVVDRTGLILDIFAQRARTYEGKLQVELAQLEHLSTRLIRGWTHLERQRGGVGMRGPGETQLETDRRLLRARIKAIHLRLAKVRSQREQGRKSRQKSAIPTVSLVGYTNAGKSTLFNQLTDANVYAADKLFATLDPTLRQLKIREFGDIVLADTVGFIRRLPHDLVDAFRSTLEETLQADLLLHVVDANHPNRDELIEHVNTVLAEIGAADVPQLLVYNKIDLLDQMKPHSDVDQEARTTRVWLSAKSKAGFEILTSTINQLLNEDSVNCSVRLAMSDGKIRAQLYELGAIVTEENLDEGGWQLEIKLPLKRFHQIFDE